MMFQSGPKRSRDEEHNPPFRSPIIRNSAFSRAQNTMDPDRFQNSFESSNSRPAVLHQNLSQIKKEEFEEPYDTPIDLNPYFPRAMGNPRADDYKSSIQAFSNELNRIKTENFDDHYQAPNSQPSSFSRNMNTTQARDFDGSYGMPKSTNSSFNRNLNSFQEENANNSYEPPNRQNLAPPRYSNILKNEDNRPPWMNSNNSGYDQVNQSQPSSYQVKQEYPITNINNQNMPAYGGVKMGYGKSAKDLFTTFTETLPNGVQVKTYECKECGTVTNRNSDIHKHIKRKHRI